MHVTKHLSALWASIVVFIFFHNHIYLHTIKYKLALQITVIFINANTSDAPIEKHRDICVRSKRIMFVSKMGLIKWSRRPEGAPGPEGEGPKGHLGTGKIVDGTGGWLLDPS